jgi:hypothetical protein
MRNISQLVATTNGKRAFLVDTLALVLDLYMSGPSLIIKIMDVIGSLLCLECLDRHTWVAYSSKKTRWLT